MVAEVALAFMLLVSAGLLVRSLQHLFAISPGFDAAHLLTMEVRTSGRRFDKDATHRFFTQALDAVREVPGVAAAGFTSQLPLSGDYNEYGVFFELQPDASFQGGFVDETLSLVVRGRGDAKALVAAIKGAIWSVDKDQPIARIATMDQMLAASAAERRFVMILLQAFALAALVLAASGLYSVLSGGVAERMREIGVRSALGASRRDIVALVVRQGMTLTGLGIVIGASGAMAAGRSLVALLFGVSPLDPATYAAVVALLLGVSAIACWIPALRAARIDPSVTLRAD